MEAGVLEGPEEGTRIAYLMNQPTQDRDTHTHIHTSARAREDVRFTQLPVGR